MSKKVIFCIFIVIGLRGIENLKTSQMTLEGECEIIFNKWWAEQAFSKSLDNTIEFCSDIDKHLQNWKLATELPFSFIYGGQNSRDFLDSWHREVKDEFVDQTKRYRTIVLTDPYTGLEVRAVCTIYTNTPGVDWTLYFTNTGKQDTPLIEQVKALDVVVTSDSTSSRLPMVYRSNGSNNKQDDWMEFEHELKKAERIDFAPKLGWSSHGANPFFTLAWNGGGVITAIGWTGQWAAAIEHTDDGRLHLQAGMEHIRLKLRPDESIRSPRILQLYWFGDHGFRPYNLFRRTMLNHIMPRINSELVLPPIAHTTSALRELNMTNEAIQFNYLEGLKDLGFESYWLDAYWIKNGWPHGIGEFGFPIDRVPDPKRFPRGIKPIGEAVKKEGLGFILWFSPEMVFTKTHLAMDFPEWVILRPGEYAGTFNLGIPEAREYMTRYLYAVIEEYKIDGYRTDNGPKVADWHYCERNTPDRLGMTEIRNVEGEYRMWDDLLSRFPHLFIDNCCGGSMRTDLETCSRAICLWNTDSTTPFLVVRDVNQVALQNQMMSANLNRYIPYSICGTIGTTPYAIRSGFNVGLCFEDDTRLPHHPRDLDLINKGLRQWPLPEVKKLEEFTDHQRDQLKKGITECKRIQKCLLGNFYPHSGANLNPRDWCVIQYHRPAEKDGIVLAFRRHESPFSSYTCNLYEIDPKARYKVIYSWAFEQSKIIEIAGDEMKRVKLEINDCPGSLLIEYKQMND